jgi:hypothetical protein
MEIVHALREKRSAAALIERTGATYTSIIEAVGAAPSRGRQSFTPGVLPLTLPRTQAGLAGFNYRCRVLQQPLLTGNPNTVPGEGVADVGPVRAMRHTR